MSASPLAPKTDRVDKSRTKDTGGYGLGLSLCQTIMQAHGGRIDIDNTPHVGTTVTLFSPYKFSEF